MKINRSQLMILSLLIITICIPLFVNSYHLNTFIMILYFAYLASAWNLVGGLTGQLSLGHAAFVGVGAYTSTILFIKFGLSPWIGMFFGALLAAILGGFLGFLSFRYGIKGPYFSLITIAFAEILVYIVLNTKFLGGASGLLVPTRDNSFIDFQFVERTYYYYIILVFLIGLLLFIHLLHKTRYGYILKAIRDSEQAASALGYNIFKYKVSITMLSAFFSAFAGTFYAQYFGYIDPHSILGINLSIEIVIFAVFGGTSSIWGPVLGAAILTSVGTLARDLFSSFSNGGVHVLIYGLFLIITILFMPRGFFMFVKDLWNKKLQSKVANKPLSQINIKR